MRRPGQREPLGGPLNPQKPREVEILYNVLGITFYSSISGVLGNYISNYRFSGIVSLFSSNICPKDIYDFTPALHYLAGIDLRLLQEDSSRSTHGGSY